jgi:uncharacterized membrane protein YjgN (DUF898 family)
MTTIEATGAVGSASPVATRYGVVRFIGDARAYWRLLIRGAALLMVTLGIYRFWLNTDMRRFLWSNTEIAGHTLEYTGTARELLLGFLIAIAILVPLNVAFFILMLIVGLTESAGLISFALLTVFGHFAIYRARRYRLTRTVYRGVRCHQTGSALRYAICAIFWWTLNIVSLGLMYPLMVAALERFKLRNTYFGNLAGRFEGSASPLFVRGLLLWAVLILPFVAGLILGAAAIDWDALMAELDIGVSAVGNLDSKSLAGIGVLAASPFWLLIVGPVLYPAFQAMIWRWWVSGLRFGDMRVSTRLRTGQVYRIYLRFLGYSFVFSLVASIMLSLVFALGEGVGALIAKATGAPADEIGTILAGIVGIGSYVVMMLGYSAIYQAVVRLGLWRTIWESADISNIEQLDHVSAAGIPSSAVGEGLADALNMGGF